MNKKSFLSLAAPLAFGALVIGALGGAAAFAHQDGGGHKRGHGMFERIDSDASGGISIEEAQAAAMARFARFDSDGDGTITQADVQSMVAERFAKMDADANGTVTHAEAREARRAWHNDSQAN